jgi:hypothetical protein
MDRGDSGELFKWECDEYCGNAVSSLPEIGRVRGTLWGKGEGVVSVGLALEEEKLTQKVRELSDAAARRDTAVAFAALSTAAAQKIEMGVAATHRPDHGLARPPTLPSAQDLVDLTRADFHEELSRRARTPSDTRDRTSFQRQGEVLREYLLANPMLPAHDLAAIRRQEEILRAREDLAHVARMRELVRSSRSMRTSPAFRRQEEHFAARMGEAELEVQRRSRNTLPEDGPPLERAMEWLRDTPLDGGSPLPPLSGEGRDRAQEVTDEAPVVTDEASAMAEAVARNVAMAETETSWAAGRAPPAHRAIGRHETLAASEARADVQDGQVGGIKKTKKRKTKKRKTKKSRRKSSKKTKKRKTKKNRRKSSWRTK